MPDLPSEDKGAHKAKQFDFQAPIISAKLKMDDHKQTVFKKKFLDGEGYKRPSMTSRIRNCLRSLLKFSGSI